MEEEEKWVDEVDGADEEGSGETEVEKCDSSSLDTG